LGGQGAFAKSRIKKGEVVYSQGGQIVHRDDLDKVQNNYLCFYMELDFYLCPIPGHIGVDWYINHSCNPNIGVPRDSNLALSHVALRDIEEGEEITYDYHEDFEVAGESPQVKSRSSFECHCGAKNCRKIIYQ
jgi:SET domain-containing protein